MQDFQPYNVAIAEIRHDGRTARITGSAATENDDAIQFIVEMMMQECIDGESVLELYSERQPSTRWYEYFAEHWPNVTVTWTFAAGDDANMEAAIGKILAKPSKPWWKLW